MADWNLDILADRLQRAALDASLWPEALTDISRQVGARGAVLVSTDKRMPGVPVSPDVGPMLDDYFKNGWSEQDIRAERGVPLMLKHGVAADNEFISSDEMRRSPYYQDWVERHGCRHWAGVGLRAGEEFWCVSLQRSLAQGPFEPKELSRLQALCRPLSEAATLASHLGFQQVLGMAHAFELIAQAAILLDDIGRILMLNDRAEAIIGEMIDSRARTLTFSDPQSQTAFSRLVAEALNPELRAGPIPQPAAVFDRRRRRIEVKAVALRDWARFSFTSAKALLLLKRLGDEADPTTAGAFGLTSAEARLAAELCAGNSLEIAARHLSITYETARSYLKNIFGKTQTKRQGELVARLLSAKYRF
jgi:DNA-binding CsgD family transcriptional regulator/PAS domain-containing protein